MRSFFVINNIAGEKTIDLSYPNKTKDLILNLTPENVTQHSRIE